MEIKLDSEAMAAVASKAIFDNLSDEMKETVIQQAVQTLLTPVKTDRYGSTPPKSPLQEAFDQAIRKAAYDAVQTRIANDPLLSEKISELLGPLLNSALSAESENYSYSLSTKLGEALGSWLADQARKGN